MDKSKRAPISKVIDYLDRVMGEGAEGDAELRCGSHVSLLLSKLPPELRSSFRRQMYHRPGAVYTLIDFSDWLQYESWCQGEEGANSTSIRDRLSHKSKRRKDRLQDLLPYYMG